MDVGIIGGGPMGLALSYYALKKGYKVSIYEKDSVLGGMSASFDFYGDVIEKYYHFFCKTDFALFELLKELDIYDLLTWKHTSMGFYYNGKIQDFGDPISLLKFEGLDIISKIRYGLFSLYCIKKQNWQDIDKKYAIPWIKSFIGDKAYNVLWDKLFALKFYEYQTYISAAWIWQRIKRIGLSRDSIFKESLGYIKGGVKIIIDNLEKAILSMGAKIHLDTGIENIMLDKKILKTKNDTIKHDIIISTIPINLLSKLIDKQDIAQAYEKFIYLDVICVVIKLKKSFSTHFWININDDKIKIPGIINYTALRDDLNSNIVYIPFYIPKDSYLYNLTKHEIENLCKSYLKMLNPALNDSDFLAFDINTYKNAQAVYRPMHLYNLPPINIYKDFYAIDASYYYPEDRGFSESVRIAKYVINRYL